ncbi:MAG: EAL domain-containing protein [Roseitalea sp.]|nr:EAL domain-containing protein [Roseitalea sp.]MBO6721830.1 EAL domain-containing protein [Roseitalea sp.]MBO6744856.1 EAL domain-containing protein [Roseitalea sp.]
MSLTNRVSTYLQDLTGSAGLVDAQKTAVVAAQVMTIFRHLPVMAVSGLIIALITAYVAWEEANFTAFAIWFGGFVCLEAAVLVLWWRNRNRVPETAAETARAVRRAIFYAAATGLFWGGLAAVLIPYVDHEHTIFAAALLTSATLVTAFSLMALLPAVLVFVLISGSLTIASALFHPLAEDWPPLVGLIATYMLFIPWLAVSYGRAFLRHLKTDIENRENAQVIGYLLDEYEETVSEWIWETDSAGRTARISSRLSARLGLATTGPAPEREPFVALLGRVVGPADPGFSEVRSALRNGHAFTGIECRVESGETDQYWRISGRPIRDDGGVLAGFVGTVRDITAEKEAKSQIIRLAHRDTLTGVFNRASFTERLESAVRGLERYGTPFTLLFLDLDKFKLVNDTYGHPVGDRLLAEVSERIQSIVRKDDCVARLGGDEFAIILEQSNDAVFAAKLASRLIASVLEAYEIDGETLWIGVSVGIALAPQHGTRPEQILRNADLALYRAKEDGRGVFRYFEAQMDFAQRERRVLEQEMHQALEDQEFRLCYQPMIGTEGGHIRAMEALIRWDHPIRGEISPVEFISIAEQSNLIVDIGKWTLRTACETATAWPDHVAVSVNVAAPHFMRSDIVADVQAVLEETGLPARRLEIEITESLLIEDSDDVLNRLIALKTLGCAIVMDDFGTGYSSLSYLLRFPFDRLKIDRSFTKDIETGDSAKAILMAIASLGDNLGIKITAEGVETRDQLDFLLEIGCDQLQGFYFSQPISQQDVAPIMLRNFVDAQQPARFAERPAGRQRGRNALAG